jgi:Ankyrin repeats (many copies)
MHKLRKNVLLLTMLVLSAPGCFSTHAADGSAAFTFSVAKGPDSPTYNLAIMEKPQHRVQFCGKHSTFFVGCRTDAISELQWAKFESALADIHFSELAADYRSLETDAPIFVLCRQAPKKCVRIEAYSGLPDELRHLDGSLVRLLNIDQWVHGSSEAVRQLRSEGRNLNALDGSPHESTLLIRALIFSGADVVAELLRDGAKPNVRDADGSTPLLRAVSNGNVEALYDKVTLLVGAGAAVCTAAPDGKTALELVRLMESDAGRPDVEEFKKTDRLLVAKGGDCVQRR